MSENHSRHDEEINLFDLFQILWDGKWKIMVTTFFALILGAILFFNTTNSYIVSTPLQKGKQSTFLPYMTLNYLLNKEEQYLQENEINGYIEDTEKYTHAFSINKNSIFEMFIKEFTDRDEIINALNKNEYTIQSLEGLNKIDKEKELNKLAKSFHIIINPPLDNPGENEILLVFEWRDSLEGIRIFNNAIQQMLINVKKIAKDNVEELVLAINEINSIKLETLINELNLVKEKQSIRDE